MISSLISIEKWVPFLAPNTAFMSVISRGPWEFYWSSQLPWWNRAVLDQAPGAHTQLLLAFCILSAQYLQEHQIFWIDLRWVGSGDSAAGSYCADRSSNKFYCKNRRMGGFLSKAMGEDWEGFFCCSFWWEDSHAWVFLWPLHRDRFSCLEAWTSMFFVLYRLHLCCVCCT